MSNKMRYTVRCLDCELCVDGIETLEFARDTLAQMHTIWEPEHTVGVQEVASGALMYVDRNGPTCEKHPALASVPHHVFDPGTRTFVVKGSGK